MRKLFEIGLNDDGFYVFPYTRPPRHNTIHGDEIRLQEAIDLRNTLNHSVATYISQLAADTPVELLREIAKHWSWHSILRFISDLLWRKFLDTPGATPQGTLYQNMMALDCIVAAWSK